MDVVERLQAIEDIRTLKARYFHGVDGKDAALLRSVFVDGAITDFRSEAPELLLRDPDRFVAGTLAALTGTVTVHTASMEEIEIVAEHEARGRWTMHDRIWVEDASRCPLPFRELQGWGYYHERYRRTADGWRVAEMRLERLKVIVV